ncbi:Hypothetical_protein [Hexamita inflata]|uniref:Hypothetical_protein n=1 Tax=Hexamita inflata TaxID=28002 RepID=A0AA86QX03_9EUKA|nr:Hypothetical protein HINF_LOCUS52422 [Hexamita inflata]
MNPKAEIAVEDCKDMQGYERIFTALFEFFEFFEMKQSKVKIGLQPLLNVMTRYLLDKRIVEYIKSYTDVDQIIATIVPFLEDIRDDMSNKYPMLKQTYQPVQKQAQSAINFKKPASILKNMSELPQGKARKMIIEHLQPLGNLGNYKQKLSANLMQQYSMLQNLNEQNGQISDKMKELNEQLKGFQSGEFQSEVPKTRSYSTVQELTETKLESKIQKPPMSPQKPSYRPQYYVLSEQIRKKQLLILYLLDKQAKVLRFKPKPFSNKRLLFVKLKLHKSRLSHLMHKLAHKKQTLQTFQTRITLEKQKFNYLQTVPRTAFMFMNEFTHVKLPNPFPEEETLKQALNEMISENKQLEKNPELYFKMLYKAIETIVLSPGLFYNILKVKDLKKRGGNYQFIDAVPRYVKFHPQQASYFYVSNWGETIENLVFNYIDQNLREKILFKKAKATKLTHNLFMTDLEHKTEGSQVFVKIIAFLVLSGLQADYVNKGTGTFPKLSRKW